MARSGRAGAAQTAGATLLTSSVGPALLRSVRFLLGVAALAAAPVLVGALAFRSLGEAGRGALAVYVVTSTIAGLVGARGFDIALLSSDPGGPSWSRSSIVNRRLVGVALVEAPAAVAVASVLVGTFDLPAAFGTWLLTIVGCDYSLTKALNLRFGRSHRVLAVDVSVACVMTVGGILAHQSGAPVNTYLIAISAAFVVGTAVARGRPAVNWNVAAPDPDVFATVSARARPLFLSKGLLLIAFRLDRLLLAAVVGLSETGVYAAAIPVAEVIGLAPLHLAQLVTVDISRDRTLRWWRSTPAKLGLSLVVVGAVMVIGATDPILRLLYDTTSPELRRTVRVLVLASVVGGLWRLAESELIALDRARATVLPSAAAATCVVVVTTVFAGRLGAVAPAVASLLGYSAGLVLVLASTNRYRSADER